VEPDGEACSRCVKVYAYSTEKGLGVAVVHKGCILVVGRLKQRVLYEVIVEYYMVFAP